MKVFISYRREDTEKLTTALSRELAKHYGKDAVFHDQTSIEVGENFRERIESDILKCDLMLAVIGPHWLTVEDERGRRLDSPSDLLRFELELALRVGLPVLPVLVEGTPPPPLAALPKLLQPLSRLHAGKLSDGLDFSASVVELRKGMENLVQQRQAKARNQSHPPRGYVLVVGGGNGEYTLELSTHVPYREGGKHSVKSSPLFGGSGVNYAAKLMGYGVPVLPILSIGPDDLGRELRNALLDVASVADLTPQVREWLRSSDFFVPSARTPRSTIIVQGGRRTILKETLAPNDRGNFLEHVKKSLELLGQSGAVDHVKAVMIGHVQADEPTEDEERAAAAGADIGPGPCTEYVVDFFHERNVPVLANFGDSQLRRRHQSWRTVLPKLEVFQLNADEAIRFFGDHDPLDEIILNPELRHSAYFVVTMDKFGALCVAKEREKGLIVVWSTRAQSIKDTTGAGDAFLSGLASRLYEAPTEFRGSPDTSILQPMVRGRLWAEFACTHLGGASETPTPATLKEFGSSRPFPGPIISDEAQARTILQVLSTAYDSRPS